MDVFKKASECESMNLPFAVVTIIGTSGTVSRKTGRMIVLKDGSSYGTIGGGTVEARATEEALKAIHEGRERRLIIEGERGSFEVFIDVPIEDRKVIIVGSGHVGNRTADLMKNTGWNVTVLDRNIPIDEILSNGIDRNTAVVITGAWGAGIASNLLKTDAFYIGILASRRVECPADKRIHSPIGLDIGAQTPEEIALSIASEITASFNGRSGSECRSWRDNLVVVRGAGDLATAVIVRLHNAGYSVVATETERPTVIRRTVSLAGAVYDGKATVEGVSGIIAADDSDIFRILDDGNVPVVVDSGISTIERLKPFAVVDAIIAKRNTGTDKNLAPVVVALGPGFEAGRDADAVIETARGHNLGRIIREGYASPNTGVPGMIAGFSKERVIHSHSEGVFKSVRKIGDIVKKGDLIAYVGESEVTATIDGMIRGLLHDGLYIPKDFKITDIDPRGEGADFLTISDKGRTISGAVLEVIDNFKRTT